MQKTCSELEESHKYINKEYEELLLSQALRQKQRT